MACHEDRCSGKVEEKEIEEVVVVTVGKEEEEETESKIMEGAAFGGYCHSGKRNRSFNVSKLNDNKQTYSFCR